MKDTVVAKMRASGFQLHHFNIDKLLLQLEQLELKVKMVGDMVNIKEYDPIFLLRQSCDDDNVKQ